MWTIMWTENSQDRWDRLETKEEVMQLLDSLDKNSGVSKGDVWIFPPQAGYNIPEYTVQTVYNRADAEEYGAEYFVKQRNYPE